MKLVDQNKAVCAKCNRPLSGDASQGLCTPCLFLRGMGEMSDERAPADATWLGNGHEQNDDSASLPIRRLGDYELLEELARGGMGVVYKARHTRLNRTVALKLISAAELSSPEALGRFQLEASAAASLEHPNIVPIHEVGSVEGQQFLSMKLLTRGNLANHLSEPGFRRNYREVATLLAKLARAVHYAHQRGVLHRDIKPSNVLLDSRGEPHLSDFGLAKLLERDNTLTRTLAVLGTPAYMSPEQASGNTKNLTTAVDIYGLGALMYEALTGGPPFVGGTTMETIRQVLDKEPKPPSQRVGQTPRDLEVICLKCLEKNPRRRYGSAEALAEDLERWSRHEPISARAPAPIERVGKWVRRNPMRAFLTASTLLASLALFINVSVMNVRLATANKQISADAEESHRRLVRLSVVTGNRSLLDMDYLRALPWFVEALRLEQGNSAREDIHRFRINVALQRSPKLEQMLFHATEVCALEFSPDGERLLTGSADRTARVWNLTSGQPITPPLIHDATVSAAKFSPDGRRVATLSLDGIARLWDASTGQPLSPLLRHRNFRRVSDRYEPALWFSPDGRQLLSAYGSPHAYLWDVETGELARSLEHPDVVYHAAFSRDGCHIVTTCEDRLARTWNPGTGALAGPTLSHKGAVAWASFSPDGERVLTVADRRTVHVWDWAKGLPIGSPINHNNVLNALFVAAFSPGGDRVLTASWDNTARVWDAATGHLVSRMNHNGGVLSAAFSPDGQGVATASWDGSARIWDVSTGLPLVSVMPQGASLLGVTFSRDGRRLAAGSVNGSVRVWNLQTSDSVSLHLPHDGSAWAEFSPDQRRIVTVSGERSGGVRLWDAQSGAPVTPLLLPGIAVDKALFCSDGSRFITVSRDQIVRIWDTQSGKESTPALVHPQVVHVASFSPDGQRVLTACEDGRARVWDATTGERALDDLLHKMPVQSGGFSPKGDLIVTASDDATACLWSASTGQRIMPPLQHRARVEQVVFSQDGRKLLTLCAARSSGGNYVRVWDTGTGRPLTPEIIHPGSVVDLAFSPDARLVATASGDGAARIWDASTGAALTPPLWHPTSVRQVLFSPDGRRLASASEDGSVLLWDAVTGELATPPFHEASKHDRIRVNFNRDGQKLLVARAREVVWVEHLGTTDRSLKDLSLQAQVLSAHRIDPVAGLVSLDLLTLSNAWQRWRLLANSTTTQSLKP